MATLGDVNVREAATEGVYEEIARLAADEKIRTPRLEVRRVGDYSSDEIQDHRAFISSVSQIATPFSDDVFGDRAMVSHKHVPVMTVYCLPRGAERPSPERVVVHRSEASLATRVDISSPLEPSEIKMFQLASRPAVVERPGSRDDFN